MDFEILIACVPLPDPGGPNNIIFNIYTLILHEGIIKAIIV